MKVTNQLTIVASVIFALSFPDNLWSQASPTAAIDTTTALPKPRKLDIFPAISYSPETKLTLGAIGIKYFDFRKNDLETPLSQLEFFAVYTTAKQLLVEGRWEFFTSQNQWRTRGEAIYNHYTDRDYGLGNDASMLIAQVSDGNQFDTLNYLLFKADRLKFSPVVLRKIAPNLHLGVQTDLEYMFNYEPVPDSHHFLNSDSSRLTDLPISGLRSGAGLQLLYDTRDFVANPIHGSLVEVNGLVYTKWLGSDYQYSRFLVDARHYVNTFSNQTLAMRGMVSFQQSDDAIPMRGLSRTNGHKLIRGYFRGTYQDNNMVAFESEYRFPFWKEGSPSKLWQVWKRLGLVAFLSGAQTFHQLDEFAFDRFNLAAGGGLRILFNQSSRVNIRIDYAFGLAKNSDGPGNRQRGLYFFLAEAF
ncbi:MAG: outer membrane protein assembly factor [Saprospiraceae bacterium]|nr:outer membrane protein assembly factor [Saprospiraceae bacterium]MCF8249320.1 outer membrane protein assembly factor [Saprospiraceae bacterium]MCF8279741.1 outer membrane protein assembly factor [Bacteroidales bacterium]MCF8311403.1 outer membrane protein assembly factor [Saprospiraceae bacterium]MCF8439939.1 outer membrane protein assembly factor [Saprospiraceae bacterium]